MNTHSLTTEHLNVTITDIPTTEEVNKLLELLNLVRTMSTPAPEDEFALIPWNSDLPWHGHPKDVVRVRYVIKDHAHAKYIDEGYAMSFTWKICENCCSYVTGYKILKKFLEPGQALDAGGNVVGRPLPIELGDVPKIPAGYAYAGTGRVTNRKRNYDAPIRIGDHLGIHCREHYCLPVDSTDFGKFH